MGKLFLSLVLATGMLFRADAADNSASVTRTCAAIICDMAEAAGDVTPAARSVQFSAAASSARAGLAREGFESLETVQAEAGPAPIAPVEVVPSETELWKKALGNFVGLLEKMYGKDKQAVPLPIPTDPLQLQSRVILRLANVQEQFSVPRRLLERIEQRNLDRVRDIRAVEEQIGMIAERLGENYRPAYYLKVLGAIDEFRQSSRVVVSSHGFFGPLIKVVYANSQDFLSVISKSAMLDEAQAQLLTMVIKQVAVGKLELKNDETFAAVEDLVIATLREAADSLLPETMTTLAKLEGFEEAVDRTRYLQKELETSRRAYGGQFYAASICYYILSAVARPDGNPALDQANILHRTRIPVLDNHPFARALALAALSDTRAYVHPTLEETFQFRIDPAAAFRKLGSEKFDPILVRQMDTGRRRQSEYARALLYARQEELTMLRAMLSERDWAKIEEKISKVAKATVNNAITSVAARHIPAPLVQAIVEHLGDPKAATKEAAAVSTTPGGELKPMAPPNDLPAYLNSYTVKTPWKTDALDFTKAPEVSGEGGRGYVYLMGVLSVLDDRAKKLLDEDFSLQRASANERKPIPSEKMSALMADIRQLLETMGQVTHALDTCFVHNGKSEIVAELVLAWHIGENFPTLQRLVINNSTHPALTGLRRRLVVHAINSAFGGDDTKLTPERPRTLFPMLATRRHKIIAALGAVTIVAGGILAYSFPWLFNNFWSHADRPQDPPPIVAPLNPGPRHGPVQPPAPSDPEPADPLLAPQP